MLSLENMTLFKRLAFFFLIITTVACSETITEVEEEPITIKEELTISVQPEIEAITVDTMVLDSITEPQKTERPSRKPAEIKFIETTHSYDTIQEGEVIEYSFKFKNIGELPLSIKDVKGSCGCTIGSYPFLDIAPNEEDIIKTRFDSKGKEGVQTTTVTVYTNGLGKEKVLTLKGFVKK